MNCSGNTGAMRAGRICGVLILGLALVGGIPAAHAAEKDPRWPANPGWQGCSAPVWPQELTAQQLETVGQGRRVLVIGDSHIRNSASALKSRLRESGWTPTIRCWGGKRLDWASEQVSRAKRLDQLPNIVVIALGTNDMRWINRSTTRARMDGLIKQLGPQRTIAWVDTYANNSDRFTTSKQKWFNKQVRRLARQHPNVHAVKWGAAAKRNDVRFVDGLHFRSQDYRLMADVLTDQVDRLAGTVER